MCDEDYIDSYLNGLLTDEVPKNTRLMIANLNDYGKRAIVNYHDPHSNFHKYADIVINVRMLGENAEENTPLFHYTTVSSLKSILESGYFRIKQANFMNDPDEFQWASKLAITYLKNYGATSEELGNFKLMIKNQPFHDAYIWSFSKNNDSETLFHVYGGNEGVALKFGEKDVMNMLVSHNSHGKKSLDQFGLGDAYTFPLNVLYDEQKQKNYIKPLVQEWLDACRGLKKDPDDMKEILTLCSKNIALFNMAFKNPKLCHEEEFRFISLRRNDGTISPELRVNGVPYINCKFVPEYVQSVILSPICNKSEEEVRTIIKKHRSCADVKKSTLPY
ncbi:hypothetical protein FD27_GL000156 [Limosilactobacillus frumenti DSM 13145]|uniref:DUF2971 domain-containing protein n=1 Tax=Limosilactobacillus frumenti DSM 13145 TaxID=1423746 RepID=A0A0R1PHG9_9LACO|nr:DUF2971 domain-containing protein [Limosilactobacillus frumenti]KRL28331.1 hypothetical protein FD27_GL000156 [Limosilactobacillus frumenti DSM 13145]QFG73013.1 DUF2971 domain-containing protein [Limosilactobacillus frumenti]